MTAHDGVLLRSLSEPLIELVISGVSLVPRDAPAGIGGTRDGPAVFALEPRRPHEDPHVVPTWVSGWLSTIECIQWMRGLSVRPADLGTN